MRCERIARNELASRNRYAPVQCDRVGMLRTSAPIGRDVKELQARWNEWNATVAPPAWGNAKSVDGSHPKAAGAKEQPE